MLNKGTGKFGENLDQANPTDASVDAAKAAFANFPADDNSVPNVSFKQRKSLVSCKSVVKSEIEKEEAAVTDKNASLYDQLGGDSQMKLFIDYFLDGIMADQELACYHEKF